MLRKYFCHRKSIFPSLVWSDPLSFSPVPPRPHACTATLKVLVLNVIDLSMSMLITNCKFFEISNQICSQGASYRYPSAGKVQPPPWLQVPPPLAVGFAEFALDKTALGRFEVRVPFYHFWFRPSPEKIFFEYLNFAGKILTRKYYGA